MIKNFRYSRYYSLRKTHHHLHNNPAKHTWFKSSHELTEQPKLRVFLENNWFVLSKNVNVWQWWATCPLWEQSSVMRIFTLDSSSEPDEAPTTSSSKQNTMLVLTMAVEGRGVESLSCETQMGLSKCWWGQRECWRHTTGWEFIPFSAQRRRYRGKKRMFCVRDQKQGWGY